MIHIPYATLQIIWANFGKQMKSAGILLCTFVKGGDGLGCDGRRW